MDKNIEVEGGEIAIQNESGDIAIIPIKDVSRVKKMLKNPSELDDYVAGLPKMADYAEDGTIISELWKERTGTDWKEASSRGLTSGSYEDNMALRKRLLSGEFDNNTFNNINTPNTPPILNNNIKDNNISTINNAPTFNEAFKIARETMGANQIFEYKGKKYGTNLKGESFIPSDETLSKAGMNTPKVKERLKDQNKKVLSPYTSKNTTKLEPEYKNWKDKKEDIKDFNKMEQASKIINYKKTHTTGKNYVVVDKKKGLLHIYQEGNDEPIYSEAVDLGANPGDAQTVTKIDRDKADINKDGIISAEEAGKAKADFTKGNKSTGAGKYYISSIDKTGYGGLPILNMMNESQYENFKKTGDINNVATSFHKGYIKDDKSRVSNGCIRCNKTTLDKLSNYLENSSEVYILPEDEGNEFVLENDKLNFKVNSKNDYENYTDSHGNQQKGQGINRSTHTLNYKPIKIKLPKDDNTIDNDFAQAIVNNKKNLMSDLKINGDVYNDIAMLALGTMGQESDAGKSVKYKIKELPKDSFISKTISTLTGLPNIKGQDLVNMGKTLKNDDSYNSRGLTQIKYDSQNQEVKNIWKKYGITKDNLTSPDKSAIATIVLFAHMYNNELKNTKLLNESGIEWQDALLYLNQGKKSELINKTATPDKNNYIQNIKKYMNKYSLEEKN